MPCFGEADNELKSDCVKAESAVHMTREMAESLRAASDFRDQQVGVVKALRRDLDAVLQRVKVEPWSRERSQTITKLQEAIMWLGMDLKRLGEANPYPKSYDPSSPVVEKTADGLKL